MKTDKEIVEMFKKHCPEDVEITISYHIPYKEGIHFFLFTNPDQSKILKSFRYKKDDDFIEEYDLKDEKVIQTLNITQLEKVIDYIKEINEKVGGE